MSENKKVDPLEKVARYSAVAIAYGLSDDRAPMASKTGEYILYSEAAAVVAAKDVDIYFNKALGITYKTLCDTLNEECKKRHKRAEAAEAVKDKNLWKERAEAAEKAFAAQSRKLQAVLPIPGVREALIELLGMPIHDKPTCPICGSTSIRCGCD